MSTGTVVRRGEPHDVPILSRLVDEVMRPYVVAGQGMAKRFPLLYQSAQANNFYFIEDHETHRPVSMACAWRGVVVCQGVRIPMAAIGSVATAREYRGRGLASTILRQIWQDLHADRMPMVLVSGQRSLYYRLGVIEAGEFVAVEMDRSTALNWDGQCERISEDPQRYAEYLLKIYRSESVRYSRSLEDMDLLLRGLAYPRKNMVHELFVAKRGEQVMAYAVVAQSDRWQNSRVMEWAGSREAVLALAHQASLAYGTRFVRLMVKTQDWSMRDIVARLRLPTVRARNLGTMAVIDWDALIETSRAGLEETGMEKIERIDSDILRDEHRAQLTRWVFSPQGLDVPWPYSGELNYV